MLAAEHARSVAMAEEARRALASPYRDLREALDWFRAEWQAALPSRIHEHGAVAPGDLLGGPAWTHRFSAWLSEGDAPDEGAPVRPPRDPLRRALWSMSRGSSLWDNAGAAFLFRLACLGYDVERTAAAMPDPLGHLYCGWYAEKAIGRLREVMAQEQRRLPARVDRLEWMDRLHIGRSDAQHAAEEAAT